MSATDNKSADENKGFKQAIDSESGLPIWWTGTRIPMSQNSLETMKKLRAADLFDSAPQPLNPTPNALICPICGTVLTSDPMHDTTHQIASPKP